MKKGYRFVTDELKSAHGNIQWKIGEWQKYEGKLEMCQAGFHASEKPWDSLNYVFGSRWFICEARGKIGRHRDKFVASEMRLVQEIPVRVIQQFAIDCATRVLPIYEKEYPADTRPRDAIEAAQAYLDNPTEETRTRVDAARDAVQDAWAAARDTARAATWAAARAATRDATRDAWAAARDTVQDAWAAWTAWTAAWAAARAATWDTAGAGERKWQNRHLLNLIREAFENVK